jgi:hypothetical protein
MRNLDFKIFIPTLFLAVLLVAGFSAITYANTDNDLCTDASGPLAVPSVTAGSTIGATGDVPPAFTCGTSVTAPGVWYTVVGTGNTMTASTCNDGNPDTGSADYDSKINIYCADCEDLTCVAGNDDGPGCAGFSSQISWNSQAGATYRILVQGFFGDIGNFNLAILDNGVPTEPDVVCDFDLIPLRSHSFLWTDPVSGGQVIMTENVFEGCVLPDGTVNAHDMTWEYVVDNLTYDPIPGVTNGFSGFQLLFPGPVPELYNQQSPAIGGPWQQNAFSGQFPPFGAEWDTPNPGIGILPDQSGTFSFCTFEREDVIVESEGVDQGPAGWAHTWFGLQAFIFHGFQSVPGELLYTAGIACSENDIICKKVKYRDEDGDDFLEVIWVNNPSLNTWSNTRVKDNFGAEIDVTNAVPSTGPVTLTTRGKSEKEMLMWEIGTLSSGDMASLVIDANTDLNPGGKQEYSECSYHEFNSGAVLKFKMPDGMQRSFETGEIIISVLTEDGLGDCDGDGFTDAEELARGTDPHDPADFPRCIPPVDPIVQDGGFETGTPNASWSEASTNFGSPICSIASCGTGFGTGPHAGDWWAWFGGISAVEVGSVEQGITIPEGGCLASLNFYLEIPVANTTGFMNVLIDGNTIFSVTDADQPAYAPPYQMVTVDVSPYADGGLHTLRFESTTDGGGVLNFFVDDVSIDVN